MARRTTAAGTSIPGALRTGVRVGVVFFCLLVIAWPWMGPLVPNSLARTMEWWLTLQCHRMPARSLAIAGVPMAVCARCLGTYLGIGLGIGVAYPRLPSRIIWTWAGCGLAALGIEWACEALHRIEPWHALRFLTGLAVALPLALVVGRFLRAGRANGALKA